MTRANLKSVSIAPDHNKPTLSKGQKAFNALIKQIEKRRARLNAWEVAVAAFHRKYLSDYVPLADAFVDLKVKLAHRLDQMSAGKGLTKTELRTLSMLITDLAGDLVAESDDAELKAIYNRHTEFDYDSEAAVELSDVKATLEEVLGLDLGDLGDINSPDDLMRRAHEQMAQRRDQETAEREAWETSRATRKKSPKQVAAEARVEAEQAQLSLSIREVYRKLASALHPDRETDPQERDRKTALMQRANQAYSKNSLLQLLELQLELEHIDQSALNNIDEDRLKHYNKILKEQVGELDDEIHHVESGFRDSYGIPPFIEVAPGTIMRTLTDDIFSLQEKIRACEQDLLMFEDIKQVKAWLKGLQRRSAKAQSF